MKKSKNSYLKALIKKYPNISSGRKNYTFYEKRIEKNIELIKKFLKDIKIT